MANKWIEHLKDFAKKHKISYSDAVSSDICRKEYYKNKEKEAPKRGDKVAPQPPPTTSGIVKKVKKEPMELMNEPTRGTKSPLRPPTTSGIVKQVKKGMTIKKNKNPVME